MEVSSDVPSKRPRLDAGVSVVPSTSVDVTANGLIDDDRPTVGVVPGSGGEDQFMSSPTAVASKDCSHTQASASASGGEVAVEMTVTPGASSSSQNAEDDDNLSVISGLSDISGKEWKPQRGKFGWLQRERARGTNPRDLIGSLFQAESDMLNNMDDKTIWMILFEMMSEPVRREKLKNFNTLEDVAQHIKSATNILVLTGAGVSVSCGIPDFRSKDGVYARLAVDFPDLPDPQAMFDIHYFRKDPRPFFKFAKEIYPGQFSPSPCHKFISCLEKSGKLLRNYSQNIDTLEQVAGITKVVQCHGSFATATCTKCKSKRTAEYVRADIMNQRIPLCSTCPPVDLQAILDNLNSSREAAANCGSTCTLTDSQTSQPQTEESASHNTQPVTSEPDLSSSQTKNTAVDISSIDSSDALTISSSSLLPPGSSSGSGGGVPSTTSPGCAGLRLPGLFEASPFTSVPIMKPDIVFFGEGLSDEFHTAISQDKEKVDLLIVIGSSLKVRPVALIPSSIPDHIPQILINRERLSHITFDVELLGDCDTIINQLCHMLDGDWSSPIHRPPLVQTQTLPDLNGSGGADEDADGDAHDSSETDKTDDSDAKRTTSEDDGEGVTDTVSDVATNDNPTSTIPISEKPTGKKTEHESQENIGPASRDDGKEKEDDEEEGEDGDQDESFDGPDESEDWKPKPISELIPEGQFLFLPPNRYVFSGAEVYADDLSDNDLDEEDDEEGDLPCGGEEEEEGSGERGSSSPLVGPVPASVISKRASLEANLGESP